jgi:hypothetical protein
MAQSAIPTARVNSGENAEGRLGATEGVLDLIRTGPGWLWAESYAWPPRRSSCFRVLGTAL